MKKMFSRVDKNMRLCAGRCAPSMTVSRKLPLVSQDVEKLQFRLFRDSVQLSIPDSCRDLLETQVHVLNEGCGVFLDPVYGAEISGAFFDTVSGTVLFNDGTVVLDSVFDENRLKRTNVYGTFKPRSGSCRREKGVCASIHGFFSNGYYHWFLEGLARLYYLSLFESEIKLLMPPCQKRFQRETLEKCLPDNIRLIEVETPGWIECERYIQISPLTTKHVACPPRECLDFIRDKMIAGFKLPVADTSVEGERIYISRGDVKLRRIVNESELVEMLAAYGFKSYALDGMSYASQVKLFQNASAICAPHGAGLTNMIYSPHIKVFELLSCAVTPLYMFLSLALGNEYHHSFALGFSPDKQQQPRFGRDFSATRDLDFSVDLNDIEAKLDEAFA